MMKYFLSILAVFFLLSCSKERISKEGDYLIFGHYYGLCVGDDCVQNYKLTHATLYKDFGERYGYSESDFRILSDEKFHKVKELWNIIPDSLLRSDKSIFGCPNCYDQGGYFIEISENDKIQNWTIDKTIKDVPEFLHDFINAVNLAITEINK